MPKLAKDMKGMVLNMNFLKKNQIIIYTVALMLVAAGYLNYTGKIQESTMQTSAEETINENVGNIENNVDEELNQSLDNNKEELNQGLDNNKEKLNQDLDNKQELNQDIDDNQNDSNTKIADVGDATLVNSNDIVSKEESTKINQVSVTSSDTNFDDYFVKSKLERDSMYSQMIETYEKILNSSNSVETQKQSATQEITKINEIKNSIMICENLIKTKGFEDCIVFVNGDSVSIVIEKDSLKQEEIAQIQNIVSRELNVKVENIHISTK